MREKKSERTRKCARSLASMPMYKRKTFSESSNEHSFRFNSFHFILFQLQSSFECCFFESIRLFPLFCLRVTLYIHLYIFIYVSLVICRVKFGYQYIRIMLILGSCFPQIPRYTHACTIVHKL